jgi:Tol biopolymer transport system component
MTIGNDVIRAFLDDEARRAVAAAPSLDQAVGRLAPRIGGQPSGASQRPIVLLAATLLLVAALATAVAVGSGILRLPFVIDDPVDLGIFEPVAGRIVIGDGQGIWGIDPAAPADPATRIQLTSGGGAIRPLGWSADGTRLLLMRDELLLVLNSDGSETQLTERPMAMRGAALSPDGSRVVYATIDGAGNTGFVFAVDADGGPAEVLLELDGLEGVSFSPDGTQIAYVSGRGDSGHRVSVMDADGTNPREILANEVTLDAGHDHGIAWSPTGDRIALGIEGTIYTFAPDGSGFAVALVGGRLQPFWSPDGSQLETRGPWHPGTVVPISSPSPTGVPTSSGRLDSPPERFPDVTNGWIAFTASQEPAGARPNTDIWFVSIGETPRRVVGADSDDVDQLCPAFAPDGRSLAYGSVENEGGDQSDPAQRLAYRDSALVIADVADDGTISDRAAIDVGDGLPPPCPVWSPDGGHVAFGVPRTSPINPETSAEGSEVWLVTLADGRITVLGDLLATDLEWSPDGDLLAIASGVDERVTGNVLHDGRIHLYEPSSGEMRSLASTLGATSFTWSPDGRRIAYATIANATGDAENELRVVDIESGEDELLAARYGVLHGIGPVWSPDGETIVYQRTIGSGERHEVVLVSPRAISGETGLPSEIVVPTFHETTRGEGNLYPYWVTWSPDGEYLLYEAWGDGMAALSGLVAVPTNPDKPSVALAVDLNFVPYDGYPDTARVPIQTWGQGPMD